MAHKCPDHQPLSRRATCSRACRFSPIETLDIDPPGPCRTWGSCRSRLASAWQPAATDRGLPLVHGLSRSRPGHCTLLGLLDAGLPARGLPRGEDAPRQGRHPGEARPDAHARVIGLRQPASALSVGAGQPVVPYQARSQACICCTWPVWEVLIRRASVVTCEWVACPGTAPAMTMAISWAGRNPDRPEWRPTDFASTANRCESGWSAPGPWPGPSAGLLRRQAVPAGASLMALRVSLSRGTMPLSQHLT
jgi:hypothetical protein